MPAATQAANKTCVLGETTILPMVMGTTDETVAMMNTATRRFVKQMSSTPTGKENAPQQSGALDPSFVMICTDTLSSVDETMCATR